MSAISMKSSGAVQAVARFNKEGHYTCPELGRLPGIDDSRFEAFRLPSRIGNQLVYPKNIHRYQ